MAPLVGQASIQIMYGAPEVSVHPVVAQALSVFKCHLSFTYWLFNVLEGS